MRHQNPDHLPPKLEAVLVRLCKKAPAPLNITKAVKLPYLVDVLACRVLGRAITEGHHETWEHGVVTSEVWHYLRACPTPSDFIVQSVPFSEEIRVEVSKASSGDDLLTEEERRIVDFVAEEYSLLQSVEIGLMTKRMNPGISAWGRNHRASVELDAFERMSPDYLEMAEMADGVSLAQLRREGEPICSPEDAVA
jgi:hypothetical protein